MESLQGTPTARQADKGCLAPLQSCDTLANLLHPRCWWRTHTRNLHAAIAQSHHSTREIKVIKLNKQNKTTELSKSRSLVNQGKNNPSPISLLPLLNCWSPWRRQLCDAHRIINMVQLNCNSAVSVGTLPWRRRTHHLHSKFCLYK